MPGEPLPARIHTVVMGAGQAGLAMSWYLRQAGREHVLLERRATLGGGWQDRWDEFRLVSPNWTTSLPGYPYDGPDPDGFMPGREVAARIAGYAGAISAPVVLGTTVERLGASTRPGGGFTVRTNQGEIHAEEVVIAAGGFHLPRIPAMASAFAPRIRQLHSHDYRNEASLPPGGVLVVGSGQSGVQLAEELHAAGRRVTLAVGKAGRVPRRYRGQDVFFWLDALARRGPQLGLSLPTVAELPNPNLRFGGTPHVSGHGGGHETNLRRLAADGIRLTGRLESADGEQARFGPDLTANLGAADTFFDRLLRARMDALIERAGLVALPDDRRPFDLEPPEVPMLDLVAEGISTVLWTSGYRLDYGWIDLPIFDAGGVPVQERGVTAVPGLTFIGFPWQSHMGSATLFGVGGDAEHLASRW